MSLFVHAQVIKSVMCGGGVKKWQSSVHVVVECPLRFHLAQSPLETLFFVKSFQIFSCH